MTPIRPNRASFVAAADAGRRWNKPANDEGSAEPSTADTSGASCDMVHFHLNNNMETLASKIKAANQTLIVKGEHDAIKEFFSPDYVAHLTAQDVAGGHKLVRAMLELYQHAFPNPKVRVEILLEGSDRIAWQRTLRATHENAFKGFPASGREIVWRDVVTSRFQDGMIEEEWVISDLAEQLLLSRKKA